MNRIFFSFYIILHVIASQIIAGDPEAIYLTWKKNPDSTMTICWLTTPEETNDLVEYVKKETKSWMQAIGTHDPLPHETPYLLHTVELENLIPNTIYTFRIGSTGAEYQFKTVPKTLDEELRFVVGGDMYQGSVEILKKTNRQAASTNPYFVLVGGDIAYASGFSTSIWKIFTGRGQKFDRWLTWLQAWQDTMVTPDGCLIPMIPTIGNHEVEGGYNQQPDKAPFFYALFPMPGSQGYQALDFGAYMSIILLDSDHTHPIDSKQAEWLASALKVRVDVPNKFALYHVPAYPSARPMSDPVSTKIRKYWVPLFDEYSLTAAFENHDHDYKRTFLLRNGKIDPKGVLYIGDGAWGVDSIRAPENVKQKWYLKRTAQIRHFLFVSLEEHNRTVTAISAEGKIIDRVVLQ